MFDSNAKKDSDTLKIEMFLSRLTELSESINETRNISLNESSELNDAEYFKVMSYLYYNETNARR